jgi:hypothetical protein
MFIASFCDPLAVPVQLISYGAVPPVTTILIEPSLPPLQLTSLVVVVSSKSDGSLIVFELEFRIQPLSSVIVTS